MSQIEKVNAAWVRIEKWYATNLPDFKFPAGAAPADIIALETHMGLTFPEELKASLTRHDGVEPWTKWQLLSIEGIKLIWDRWTDLIDKGLFDNNHENIYGPNDFIQKCWWNKSWIPIDADSSGNSFMIDLSPGPKGIIGQILYHSHEIGPQGPKNPDYAAYLEEAADGLEAGDFIAEYGGVTRKY